MRREGRLQKMKKLVSKTLLSCVKQVLFPSQSIDTSFEIEDHSDGGSVDYIYSM